MARAVGLALEVAAAGWYMIGIMKRRSRRAASLAVLAALTTTGAGAQTAQEVILRAKPAAVLVTARVDAEVTLSCGAGATTVTPAPFVETGTGWVVDGRGWVVTNAHVVDPAHTAPPWVVHELKRKAVDQACVAPVLARQGLRRGQRPDVEDQIRATVDLGKVEAKVAPAVMVMLSNGRTVRGDVTKFSPPLLLDAGGKPLPESGRDLALLRIPDGTYPALAAARSDPRIGDPIHVIGFPGVVLAHELLGKTASVEASVTNGSVSGVRQDAIGQDVIQTDAPAAHGNSGGPAIGQDGTVVGVLTFVSLSAGGDVVQGFNFLIPARDVTKFLAGTDVRAGESRFNAAWTAGLMDLAGDRYARALAALREADALMPGQPDVKRALQEADAKVKNPPPRPLPWAWITLALVVASGGGYGALAYRRWRNNRFRIKAKDVARMMEEGANPMLLDVRQPSAVTQSALRIPGARYIAPDALEKGQLNLDADPARTVVAYCT
ncbi:MAG: trypsin-like peptidase domain-containing protein [Candidatus Rokubacteria bacterium]|nr:trypsin-like peptidase domain-containing protein [Candidatus Rokubacteria bacterium]